MTFSAATVFSLASAQENWFVAEVHRCRERGIPLGCCDEWPECSHMLAWWEAHREEILGMKPVILNGDLNGIV